MHAFIARLALFIPSATSSMSSPDLTQYVWKDNYTCSSATQTNLQTEQPYSIPTTTRYYHHRNYNNHFNCHPSNHSTSPATVRQIIPTILDTHRYMPPPLLLTTATKNPSECISSPVHAYIQQHSSNLGISSPGNLECHRSPPPLLSSWTPSIYIRKTKPSHELLLVFVCMCAHTRE